MGLMSHKRSTTVIALGLVFLTLPAQARAEYTRIELKILGMDCAICAHGVRVAVQKVDGVEGVVLSLERAQADIRLRPDNRATLDDFRRIVKANGFEPKEARVTAVGAARASEGKIVFEVAGVATPLVVSVKSDAAAHERSPREACSRSQAWSSKLATAPSRSPSRRLSVSAEPAAHPNLRRATGRTA
jgi:cation transport ATPase